MHMSRLSFSRKVISKCLLDEPTEGVLNLFCRSRQRHLGFYHSNYSKTFINTSIVNSPG